MEITFKEIYLIFNFIVGSIYLTWIYWLIYFEKCKCSITKLQHYIHIYWYIIFTIDLLVFFNYFNINDYYLIILGNLLGLGNIYMTYKYINETYDCNCSNGFLKDFIILIYISTIIISLFYMIGLLLINFKL